MNARAHLKGLGWRGDGHSLDTTDRGLKRPLLISHKYDLHGLGSKKQAEKHADQWWLNAFDNALKDIGSGKESSLSKIQQDSLAKGSGLYGFFVRGGGLEGTFELAGGGSSTPSTSSTTEETSAQRSTPRIPKSASQDAEIRVRKSKKSHTVASNGVKDKKRKTQIETASAESFAPVSDELSHSKRCDVSSSKEGEKIKRSEDGTEKKESKKRRREADTASTGPQDVSGAVRSLKPMSSKKVLIARAELSNEDGTKPEAKDSSRVKEKKRRKREARDDQSADVTIEEALRSKLERKEKRRQEKKEARRKEKSKTG